MYDKEFQDRINNAVSNAINCDDSELNITNLTDQIQALKNALELSERENERFKEELFQAIGKEYVIIEKEIDKDYKHLSFKDGRKHTLMRVKSFIVCKAD